MRIFRLFISSPSDVQVERRRCENVVSRLNGEFFGLARIVTVRWETEFYRADATFQTQIPPAADCDIVIGILKWRIGTELPPDFGERLPDGRAYPSGTAYELLTAVHRRQSGADLPDVFVFRYAGGSPRLEIEDPTREQVEREWATLRTFFQSWFVTSQGQFIAALNQYASEDQFESQLETLLRKWLAEKVANGRVVPWPATKGSPFRGLNVFGTRHASVFFGRNVDVRKACDLWRDAAGHGATLLLIVGASGAGKSSMARAGLIPRIITPGFITGVDAWRVAAMRPSDSPDGPFAALAAALLQTEAELPAGDEGRGPALPEIAEGDSKTPAELAGVLSHADEGAVRPLINALARIGERARERERYGRDVRCDLVLLLDQLDEIFAPSISADVRGRFADLMSALVASGRVWLLATLRADLYQQMLAVPSLKTLKDHGTSYDLVPPGPAELTEIVREPAKAAGLIFETDAATGEQLDERLLREADRPDMLPLVQLALSRLWECREIRGHDTVLPFAAFERIGGVKGIIEDAGEKAFSALGDVARAALAPLIRRLAVMSHADAAAPGTLTARAVPLADVVSDPDARRLVDALLDARLLALDRQGGASSLRLTHQRILTDWARVATIVSDSAEFYRVRDTVEDQRQRWEAGRRRGDLLLARGLPLAEARAMAVKYGRELTPALQAYITASRRRANRLQTFGWIVAAACTCLAAVAGIEARVAHERTLRARAAQAFALEQARQAQAAVTEAEREREHAQRNFAAAKATVDSLIFDIAEGLRSSTSVRIDTIQRILETARRSVDLLLAAAPDDRSLLQTRLVMLKNFTDAYLTVGDTRDAIKSAEETLAMARRLAAAAPADLQSLRDLALSLKRAGDVRRRSGDPSAALQFYEERATIDRQRMTQDSDDVQARRDTAASLNDIGDLRLTDEDRQGALDAFTESLGISRALNALHPDDLEAKRAVATSLSWIGKAYLVMENQSQALAACEEGFAISKVVADQKPDDVQAQRDFSASAIIMGDVKLLAGDAGGALAAYNEGLNIRRKLVAQDPGNAEIQFDISVVLNKIGDLKGKTVAYVGALAAYQESSDIRHKLLARDAENPERKRALLTSLNKMAEMKLVMGDQTGAAAIYQEIVDVRQDLAREDPKNPGGVSELCQALERLGGTRMKSGDLPGALAAFESSLHLLRERAAQNPVDVRAQRDVEIILVAIAGMRWRSGDTVGARAVFAEAGSIAERLLAADPSSAQLRDDLAAVRAAADALPLASVRSSSVSP